MKIEKFKKLKNGIYELQLDNYEKIYTYEEIILEEELLLKRQITTSQINKIAQKNKYYDCYYKALKIIKKISKTRYELYTKLKEEFDGSIIDNVLDNLEKKNYINDKIYANSYINLQINTTYHGPLKIKKEMLKKGISNEIIDEVITQYNQEIQREKIEKIINKKIKSNHNKSNVVLIRKIKNDLQIEGFDYNLINSITSNIKIESDDDIKQKEYNKIKTKLQKKYSGEELEYKIRQKMFQKGFY